MINIDELIKKLLENNEIKEEYRKALLLNMFQKIYVRMERNVNFKRRIRNLFSESHNVMLTTKIIIGEELKCDITDNDAQKMAMWFEANFKKSQRKKRDVSIKEQLYKKQHGKCMVCGEDLGNDWSKIHVDHIIPHQLVGDELDDNYQDLCETCNKCKGARTDFLFKSMLKLV